MVTERILLLHSREAMNRQMMDSVCWPVCPKRHEKGSNLMYSLNYKLPDGQTIMCWLWSLVTIISRHSLVSQFHFQFAIWIFNSSIVVVVVVGLFSVSNGNIDTICMQIGQWWMEFREQTHQLNRPRERERKWNPLNPKSFNFSHYYYFRFLCMGMGDCSISSWTTTYTHTYRIVRIRV